MAGRWAMDVPGPERKGTGHGPRRSEGGGRADKVSCLEESARGQAAGLAPLRKPPWGGDSPPHSPALPLLPRGGRFDVDVGPGEKPPNRGRPGVRGGSRPGVRMAWGGRGGRGRLRSWPGVHPGLANQGHRWPSEPGMERPL